MAYELVWDTSPLELGFFDYKWRSNGITNTDWSIIGCTLHTCNPMCGAWTRGKSSSWEHIRAAESQVLWKTYWIIICILTKIPKWPVGSLKRTTSGGHEHNLSVPQTAELWNPSVCLCWGQDSQQLLLACNWLQQEYYAGTFSGNWGLPPQVNLTQGLWWRCSMSLKF